MPLRLAGFLFAPQDHGDMIGGMLFTDIADGPTTDEIAFETTLQFLGLLFGLVAFVLVVWGVVRFLNRRDDIPPRDTP
jgi:hypothetical protein